MAFRVGPIFQLAIMVLFYLLFTESRNTKQTLYLRHRKNKLRKNKSGHACSQRAQLLGVTLHELRGQKLAEILIFYVGQKISGPIFEPIGLKLLIKVYHMNSYMCVCVLATGYGG